MKQRGLDPVELCRNLRLEMDIAVQEYRQGYISLDVIAGKKYFNCTRSRLDVLLHRAKKVLPWLGELKDAVE